MKKKFLSVALTLAMTLTGMTFTLAPVSAGTEDITGISDEITYTDPASFTGKMCTGNTGAMASIDYIKAKYPNESTYPGSGECWGYAEKVNSILASASSTKYYKGLKFNEKNFKNKCLNAKAGTHIRLHRQPEFNAWSGHSVVLFKVTEEQVCWADNNYIGSNTVGYCSGTLQEFLMYYGQYGYINMVKTPTKYKTYSAPQVASSIDSKTGAVKVSWLKTTGTTRYDVYRSYSKNGKYTRIAKTTSRSFTDKKGTIGKKAYYKVKSVKSSGSKYSNITGRTGKLAQPVITAGNDKDGNIQLTWKAVPKADKYYVYRWSWDTWSYKRVKTTTSCTYTDKETDYGAEYVVKAVYAKNSAGNSLYSNEVQAFRGQPEVNAPNAPVIDGLLSGDSAYLRWDYVDGADWYAVYCSDSYSGTYTYCGDTYSNYFEDSDRLTGENRYYKVTAVNGNGEESGYSNIICL